LTIACAAVASAGERNDEVRPRAASKTETITQLARLSEEEQTIAVTAYADALTMFKETMNSGPRENAEVSALAITKQMIESGSAVALSIADALKADVAKPIITIIAEAGKTGVAVKEELDRAKGAKEKLSLSGFSNLLVMAAPPTPRKEARWADFWRQNLASRVAGGEESEAQVLAQYAAAIDYLERKSLLPPAEVKALVLLEFYEAWLNATYVDTPDPKPLREQDGRIIGPMITIDGNHPGPGKLFIRISPSPDPSGVRFVGSYEAVEPSTPLADQVERGINEALAQLTEFRLSILDLCVHKRVCFRTDDLLECMLLGPANNTVKAIRHEVSIPAHKEFLKSFHRSKLSGAPAD
jgi:hypothetical protein